ncbi:MAG: hypothetical protein R3F53_02060 [Gammaproteobacteria bacterium]
MLNISRVAFIVAAWWLTMAAVYSEPFLPQNDSQVLERLPSPTLEQQLRQRAVSRDPANLPQALELAWAWVRLGREQADPRYYGYAEAVLGPWWATAERWPEVLLLRATLHQNRHDFQAALADLSQVLKRQPRNAQAWLTRSVILAVLGQPRAAWIDCQPLLRLSSALLTATCMGNALSLAGEGTRAYELVHQVWSTRVQSNTEEQQWALTLLAEIALRQDHSERAEQHFLAALALPQRDVYLLGAYADFLLQQGRFQRVQALLANDSRADALLLRLALAEQHLNPVRAAQLADAFEARLRALQRRGENSHLGDGARFLLELRRQPAEALRLAQANWAQQHDPASAYLVLAAAIAANEPQACRPVQRWLQRTGLHDARLQALLAKLPMVAG